MKNLLRIVQLLFICTLLFTSCKKDKTVDPDPNDYGDDQLVAPGLISLKFENVVGNEALQLDNKWYINQNADSFTVSILRYYISNIQLIKADGNIFSEPESYHLIDQGKSASQEFTINKVPPGKYKGIRFLIGVDSTRNVSGAQSGALDPSHGMFWTWNSGYIMAKLEGDRPKSGSINRSITYHIGGFTGNYNALRKVEFNFATALNITELEFPAIVFNADILEWFKTPHIIKFDEFSDAMHPSANSKKMADNYSDMFTVKRIDVIMK